MTFDVFGDFEERGYLRNVAGLKDLAQVRQLEHRVFLIKVGKALTDLSARDPLTYADILQTHRTLFASVYPWAGRDRLEIAPHANISRGGYDRMFAFPKISGGRPTTPSGRATIAPSCGRSPAKFLALWPMPIRSSTGTVAP